MASMRSSCTLSGSLSSSEELLTSAGRGAGGAAAWFEIVALVGRSCVIWRNSKDEMMRWDPAALDPYSLRTAYAGICTLSAASLSCAYILPILPTHVFPHCMHTVYRLRTVSVLYSNSLCKLGGDPCHQLVGGESTWNMKSLSKLCCGSSRIGPEIHRNSTRIQYGSLADRGG